MINGGPRLLRSGQVDIPAYAEGFHWPESHAGQRARVAPVDAVNLDGGGSTAMTVASALVTRPSDTTGERPIADALVMTGG